MPKATTVQEEEVPVEDPPEATEEAPEEPPDIPEIPAPEVVVKPKRAPKAKASTRKDAPAPTKGKVDLKQRHTCGACGATMSLHTVLYGHKNCPGQVTVPQPPALTRQVAVQEEEAVAPEPQLTQAQMLRLQLARAAQERRAQAQLRMVDPIRQFYGLT